MDIIEDDVSGLETRHPVCARGESSRVFRSSRPIMPLSLLPAPGSCLLPIQTGLLSLELLLGLSWHLVYGEIKNPVACGLKERRSPGLRLTLSRSSSLLFVRPG